MRPKVTIIGAGNTGSATALWLAEKDLCDIVLLDILPGRAEGKAIDLQEAMPILGHSTIITGTEEYQDTAGSDVIVITAGSPRKPGMTREDLVQVNAGVVSQAVEETMKYSPDAVMIVLTNPVDALTYLAFRNSGLPKHRVIGQGGILDFDPIPGSPRPGAGGKRGKRERLHARRARRCHGADAAPIQRMRGSASGSDPDGKAQSAGGAHPQPRNGNRQFAENRQRRLRPRRGDHDHDRSHIAKYPPGDALFGLLRGRVRLERVVFRSAGSNRAARSGADSSTFR